LHHFRVNYEATQNREWALIRAVHHSGRAMVSTTLILMLGFFTYLAADMSNIFRFGLLVGSTALLALLVDLLFAPALIRTIYPLIPSTQETPHAQ
jgi:predicted RND superfamily exporter protein